MLVRTTTGFLITAWLLPMTLPEKEAGEDFKTNDAVCYAVFRASTAKVRIIIKTNLKRTRDNQYEKKRND